MFVPRFLGSSACADGAPPSGNRRRSRLRNLQLLRHAQPTHGCLLSSGIRGGGAGGSAAGGSQPESLVAASCAYFPDITRGRLARSVRPFGSPGPRGLSESSDSPQSPPTRTRPASGTEAARLRLHTAGRRLNAALACASFRSCRALPASPPWSWLAGSTWIVREARLPARR